MNTDDLETRVGRASRYGNPDIDTRQDVLAYMQTHSTLPSKLFFAKNLTRVISSMLDKNPSCLGELLPLAFEYNMQGVKIVQEEKVRKRLTLESDHYTMMEAFFHSHGADIMRIQAQKTKDAENKFSYFVDWYSHKKDAGTIASPVNRLYAARFFWDAHKAALQGQLFAEEMHDDEHIRFFSKERYEMAVQAASHFYEQDQVMCAIAHLAAGDVIYADFTKSQGKRPAQLVKRHYSAFLKSYGEHKELFAKRKNRSDELRRSDMRVRQAMKVLGERQYHPTSQNRRRMLERLQ
jgi:hypothetical protein